MGRGRFDVEEVQSKTTDIIPAALQVRQQHHRFVCRQSKAREYFGKVLKPERSPFCGGFRPASLSPAGPGSVTGQLRQLLG